MNRRAFLATLGTGAMWPIAVRAQQRPVKRVVVLSALSENDPDEQAQFAVFRDGLTYLGWVAGQDIHFERVHNADTAERTTLLVARIVQNPPDVVVANASHVFREMQTQAGAIPVVFTNLPDPVGMGLVVNLSKPGGNFTGFTTYEFAIAGKWLQLLRELAPRVSRVAMILANSPQPTGETFYRAMQVAARPIEVETTAIRVESGADVRAGIDTFAIEPNGGLLIAPDAAIDQCGMVIDLAARHQIPAIYPVRQAVHRGGLAFYGVDLHDQYWGAAAYVDRILRGAKPGDLPIRAPTNFELVVNGKAAKALGLTIPLSLRARADEVIE
jgi:putative tryptophan/tyrosine transport system substrate-binding protein